MTNKLDYQNTLDSKNPSHKQRKNAVLFHYTSLREAIADECFQAALLCRIPNSLLTKRDLFQETVVRGLDAESRGTYFPSKGSPMAFYLAIARNIHLESLRAWYRRPKCGSLQHDPVDEHQAALDLMLCDELWNQVKRLLDALPEEKQNLVYKRYRFNIQPDQANPLTNKERTMLRRILAKFRLQLDIDE